MAAERESDAAWVVAGGRRSVAVGPSSSPGNRDKDAFLGPLKDPLLGGDDGELWAALLSG